MNAVESTNVKYRTFIIGSSVMYTINYNHRVAATSYATLETWFVLGI